MAEYRAIAFFVIGFSIFLEIVLGVSDSWIQATFTVIAFIVGCSTSVLAGYVGMAIGTFANARTALSAFPSIYISRIFSLRAHISRVKG